MESLAIYRIAFRGLQEGRHTFDYVLDEAFFDCFEAVRGTRGRVNARVELVKSALLMELKIGLSGEVEAICDRCLERLSLPVSGQMTLILKESGREEGNEDDFLILEPGEDWLDVSGPLYETYMLHYPMRVVHAEGACDPGMTGLLNNLTVDEESDRIDPRWDELRKLINN